MDRYLDGEDLDVDALIDDLETAVNRGSFHPVIPACAAPGWASPSSSRCSPARFPPPL